jgi:hypothetical protein
LGPDIGDRVGEDVRPLLFGERGLLSVLLRLLVDDARLLPLLDIADHDAVADHHLERIDRAAIGQRIDINRFDPIVRRVAEDLGDAGAKRGARHRHIDIDAETRGVDITFAFGFKDQRS